MGRVDVKAPGGAYPVLVGQGALLEMPGILRDAGIARVAIVTDDVVAGHWADGVSAALTGAGVATETLVVAAGEGSKSFEGYKGVLAFLERIALDRHGAVLALGGGIVGDLAGFAAATWLRGVRLVQVPTTLLAMVDSAIGGKTGINTSRSKNAVGAFHQPVLVIEDLATLGTLPEGEFLAAFAEVIKYAMTMDAALALTLATDADRLRARDLQHLEAVVERCVAAKGRVVAEDERESGARAILNYGHTTGHAIEAASNFTASHGRAVAQGMRVAAHIAARVGACTEGVVAQQEELLRAYGLPGRLPAVTAESVLSAIPRDKKSRDGRVGWVLPRAVGKAVVGQRVPDEVVAAAVREVLG